jgi:hypothetical protein
MAEAETLRREQVVAWLERAADALQIARDTLTELDAAIATPITASTWIEASRRCGR